MLRKASVLLLVFSAYCLNAQDSATLEQRARQSLPQISGTLKAQGLQKPVTVLRDRWGVAHIYAENQHDLFFAQGYVTAQDRLFQMELWKRSGQGRLAEVLGPSALPRDVNARRLRYRGPMDPEYSSYAPDGKEILTAFTDGINAYIASLMAPAGAGFPLEFQLAGFAPEPWKPEDCLNRMAAYAMTGNSSAELYDAQLVSALGPEKAASYLELDPPVKLEVPPHVDYAGLNPEMLKSLVGSDTRIEFPAGTNGSNNWTVSGALTASGKPLLANDPHRTIAVPSLRYIVHLVAPGWDAIGATEPGLPGVAIGHNQRIAWGLTIFGIDQHDLYLETLNPNDPMQYKTEHGWAQMQTEQQTFHVKGAKDEVVTLKYTRHGPVLWQQGTRALALRWVGAEPGTAGYLASLSVGRAQNWRQFLDAMGRWKVPSENMVYADVDGNIGEQSAGLTPLRKNWTGLLPVPGDGGYEWAGFVPTDQLPRHYNPAEGFIATANHKMIPPNYPYPIGFSWAPRDRIQRIEDVLNQARSSGHKLEVADMQRLQTDVVSLPAQEFVKLLQGAVRNPVDKDAAVTLLLNWDGSLTRDSAAGALYEYWEEELHKALLQRAVPEGLRKEVHFYFPYELHALRYPTSEIFGLHPEEARDKLLLDTVHTAASKLSQKLGPDPNQWAWGKLHYAEFKHPVDKIDGAASLVDLGPIPRPGDGTTVYATFGDDEDFRQLGGASYREIFDLSNWDNSVGINVPGQSGQPGSPHYSDLLPLWAEGQYFPLKYSRAEVEKVTQDKLVLEPK